MNIAQDSLNKPVVFVISPIGAEHSPEHDAATKALKYIYRAALPPNDWTLHRADEAPTPDSINQHVIKSIVDADLIIADLTGHNPNVFYELALAHSLKKPVVHAISAGERIPFDIVDMRTIFYDLTDLDSVAAAVEKVRAAAESALKNADSLVTPLSAFAAFRGIETMAGSDDGVVIGDVLGQILQRLRGIEAHLGVGRPDLNIQKDRSLMYQTLTELAERGVFDQDDVNHLERELLYILNKRHPHYYAPQTAVEAS